MKIKKIAVIGSGFFGSTAALLLSKNHKVHLFEKKNSIMCGASRANQQRFHLGYHYPRSTKTVLEIKKNYKEFINFFGSSVFSKTENYYGISKDKSKTSFKKYLIFLKKNKLRYRVTQEKNFSKKIEGQIISDEKNLNYFKIKKLMLKKLKKEKIKIYYNTTFSKKLIKNYDKIIIATYDQNNMVIKQLGQNIKTVYKYELVEKIIIKLPADQKNKSYMVLDGKFVCLDPYLGTKYHLLSDVKYSKLEVKKGKYSLFKNLNKKYLNSGIIRNKKNSQFNNFIKHGSQYLPILKKAKYIGSFYVTRALQINKETTDERTSEISKKGNKIISIYSGKWNTCVGVAKKIVNMI
jgi:D-amino-acid oxidase